MPNQATIEDIHRIERRCDAIESSVKHGVDLVNARIDANTTRSDDRHGLVMGKLDDLKRIVEKLAEKIDDDSDDSTPDSAPSRVEKAVEKAVERTEVQRRLVREDVIAWVVALVRIAGLLGLGGLGGYAAHAPADPPQLEVHDADHDRDQH